MQMTLTSLETPTVKGIFNRIEKATRKVGLKINEEKTKYICINRQGRRDRAECNNRHL